MQKKGKFIVFEGLDGSGKSTQISYLANKLRLMGYKVYETFEPTDGPVGSLIHQIMIGRINADPKVIASLFAADRIDHLTNDINGIYRKISNGVIVICDRYYFSSFAYQGIYIPLLSLLNINAPCMDILRPDINIYLDISAEICLDRLSRERWHLEIYENLRTMRSVREKYLETLDLLKEQEKILRVDADASTEDVAENIWMSIKHLFERDDLVVS